MNNTYDILIALFHGLLKVSRQPGLKVSYYFIENVNRIEVDCNNDQTL